MSKVTEKLKEEFLAMIPPTLFFVLMVMYCTTHELARTIGREKVMRIFFGPMPAPEV